jgi:hypothetical protein
MAKLFNEMEKQIEANPRLADVQREVKQRLQVAVEADAEMHSKAIACGKKISDLEAKLPGEQALLDRMKTDCLKLQGENRARKQAAAVAVEKQLHDDVMAGKIGVVEYHEKMTAHMAKVKSEADQIDREIELAIFAVREKALSVLRMEMELWQLRTDFYYLSSYPSEVGLGELKKLIQEMSYRSQALSGKYRAANVELERVKEKSDRAQGRCLASGWVEDNLTIEQIRVLPLLPEIPEKYLPSLSAITLEIEANEKARLEAGQQPGLYFIRVSYLFGASQPWEWLCRNANSAIIQMNKTNSTTGIVTMSDLPKKSMEV